jgi:hypothetical protein
LVTVARLADFYEAIPLGGQDPLDVATHDFRELKRKAPDLVRALYASARTDREIGDWLFSFFGRYKASGQSLKHFAEDELERLQQGAHARKKSARDLQRDIDAVLARPAQSHATKPKIVRIHIGNGLLDGVGTAAANFRLKQLRDTGATDIKLAKTGRLQFTRNGQRYEYSVTLPRDTRDVNAFALAGTTESPLTRALADIAAGR